MISGSNFSATAADNDVKFNGKTAKVTAATAASLTVEVPKSAGNGVVTVTVKGKTATGPAFTYIFTGTVSTLAGSTNGYLDGTGAGALFHGVAGICVDAQGNLYVSDHYNHKIRKITPAGVVSTLAGSIRGYADGTGTAAQFWNPSGIAVDPQGNVFVADAGNHRIRRITPAGVVSTYAGKDPYGYEDGAAHSARFFGPEDVTLDANGNVYVGDANNYKVRKITPGGVVSTLAGSTYGYQDGTGSGAIFYTPRSIQCDAQGNVFVSDYFNQKIRKVTPGGVVTTVAGSTYGWVEGSASTAKFEGPRGMVITAQGEIFVVEDRNNTVRKLTAAFDVSTLCGQAGLTYSDWKDGTLGEAKFRTPMDICADAQGNFYIADFNNNRVRKISFE